MFFRKHPFFEVLVDNCCNGFLPYIISTIAPHVSQQHHIRQILFFYNFLYGRLSFFRLLLVITACAWFAISTTSSTCTYTKGLVVASPTWSHTKIGKYSNSAINSLPAFAALPCASVLCFIRCLSICLQSFLCAVGRLSIVDHATCPASLFDLSNVTMFALRFVLASFISFLFANSTPLSIACHALNDGSDIVRTISSGSKSMPGITYSYTLLSHPLSSRVGTSSPAFLFLHAPRMASSNHGCTCGIRLPGRHCTTLTCGSSLHHV